MHDACHGSNSFKTFELLLKADPDLIRMMDGRPLSTNLRSQREHAGLGIPFGFHFGPTGIDVMLIKQSGSSAFGTSEGKQSAQADPE
jgi:hypothetical protein